MKKLLKGIFMFLKKWGAYGVVGYLTLYLPLGLGFLLDNQELQTVGWIISAIVAAPNGVGLLLTLLFASFYKWLLKVVIIGFIKWSTETMKKLQIQNQLGLYYSSEEIEMFLNMGKKIKYYSDEKKKEFQDNLRKERIKKIDDQWTKESDKKQTPTR